MPKYLYTYACHEDERSLCDLELRSLFGVTPVSSYFESSLNINPSRSPFIKLQMQVIYEAKSLEELTNQVEQLHLKGSTFKVVYIEGETLIEYDERRRMERTIGGCIRGKADMRNPDQWFGFIWDGCRWLFGECRYNEAVWLQHRKKPQNYSTALSTRVARAVANIAVPDPEGIHAIDPCCGIGTVLIEALSMGMHMIGSDINPLAIRGARINLQHFGYSDVVKVENLLCITGTYDVAVVDLPYNLCSKITLDEQLELLQGVRKFSRKMVVIATETIDSNIERADFNIIDRCLIKKGTFTRQVTVCI